MLVHAFEKIPDWRDARERLGHMLVALDFDGTIAPIVPHPDDAQLLPHARPILERLARRADTEIALISGRGLKDLVARVGIANLYYAGNHGLEIHGPDLDDTVPGALALQAEVQRCRTALEAAVAAIPGAHVEDKQLSLSVHYRMVDDPEEQRRVEQAVRHIFERHPDGLRLTTGKRVLEVRPDIDWHKGKALLYIIDEIASVRGPQMLPMFVGDDKTDEDGFAALPAGGAGVLVGAAHAHTAAGCYLRSPDEAVEMLERLL
ncbi:MAG TPA: trehalose-phosphatase [Longimicrobiales bacterium]|nr:trehalose-phosphatase [Longimicrobiales bacterium]